MRNRIKLKDDIKLEELEKYGFKDGIFKREFEDNILYAIVVTAHHRYIKIKFAPMCYGTIAGSLQCLLFDMINDGILEKVEV